MKKFIVDVTTFIAIFLFFVRVVDRLEVYIKLVPSSDVYKAIATSENVAQKTEILLAGNNIGQQLFQPLNSLASFTSIACNQAIDIMKHH